MTRLIDDPRLTAYALGELPDSERHDMEALLRDSAEAREWVEEVRDTGDELRHALQSTAAACNLPASCDASVADRTGGSANFAAPALGGTFAGASLRHWLHIVRLPMAVAASLTLTVLVAYPLMTPQLSRSREFGLQDRVASSQREQERSDYKEVAEGTVLGKQLTAETRKDERAADSSSGASTGTNWSGTTNPPSAPGEKDTVSRLMSDLEESKLPWTPQRAESETVAGQIVVVQRDQANGPSACQTTASWRPQNTNPSELERTITELRQRAVVAGTPLALIDPVTSAYLLRREDGSPDTRPFSRLGFTRGAPESPDGGIGGPFSGGNWLIGGNASPEATGSAAYTVKFPPTSYADHHRPRYGAHPPFPRYASWRNRQSPDGGFQGRRVPRRPVH